MGLYLKSHHKKTEDEVLDYFGAEGDDDSDSDNLLETEKRRPSQDPSKLFAASEAQHSSTPIAGALGLLAGNKSRKPSVKYLLMKIRKYFKSELKYHAMIHKCCHFILLGRKR